MKRLLLLTIAAVLVLASCAKLEDPRTLTITCKYFPVQSEYGHGYITHQCSMRVYFYARHKGVVGEDGFAAYHYTDRDGNPASFNDETQNTRELFPFPLTASNPGKCTIRVFVNERYMWVSQVIDLTKQREFTLLPTTPLRDTEPVVKF